MMQSLRKRQLVGQVNGIDVTRIVPYPASRGYIFAVRVVVRKVASADNRSIFYRACVQISRRI